MLAILFTFSAVILSGVFVALGALTLCSKANLWLKIGVTIFITGSVFLMVSAMGVLWGFTDIISIFLK